MIDEDVIEEPLEPEEPGTYLSNLVITDKKWYPKKIRVTLDCHQVNKNIFHIHENNTNNCRIATQAQKK